jgi:hypothetical protein
MIGLAYRYWGDGTVALGMLGLVIEPGHRRAYNKACL